MSLAKTLKELERYTNLIRESYVFDEENMDMPMDGGEQPMVDDEMPMADATEKILQVRNMAIEGIEMFKNNVDSEEYDFFKKIWLMCDKVMSEKDNMKDEE